MTAEEIRLLTAAAQSRSRVLRFSPRLERSYRDFVRTQAHVARMALLLLSLSIYLVAPVWTLLLPYAEPAVRGWILAIELGLMAPALFTVALLQWRRPTHSLVEALIVVVFLLEMACVEVMLHLSADAGVTVVPSIAVIVPVAVLALARLPTLKVVVLLAGYGVLALAATYLLPHNGSVRSPDHWLLEGMILALLALSSLWSKGIMRRQWAANALLEMMAYRDGLTGLPNRRAFEEHYDLARRALGRSQTRTAMLALIDLDHFKKINDTYGHGYGDGVLVEVGLTLAQYARRSMDMAARLGGEEFALLLYACDLDAGKRRLQELQAAIRGLAIEHSGNDPGIVTCSIGAVVIDPEVELAEAYHTADQRLYHIKHHGRDGTSIAAAVAP